MPTEIMIRVYALQGKTITSAAFVVVASFAAFVAFLNKAAASAAVALCKERLDTLEIHILLSIILRLTRNIFLN